jgi:hypothetical protein
VDEKTDWDVQVYNADFSADEETMSIKEMDQCNQTYLAHLNDKGQPIWDQVREAVGEYPEFDIAVSGEGEMTLVEVLDALAGLMYRSWGEIMQNQPPGYIDEMDTLPIPHMLAPREVASELEKFVAKNSAMYVIRNKSLKYILKRVGDHGIRQSLRKAMDRLCSFLPVIGPSQVVGKQGGLVPHMIEFTGRDPLYELLDTGHSFVPVAPEVGKLECERSKEARRATAGSFP